jgi:hypothetical protein
MNLTSWSQSLAHKKSIPVARMPDFRRLLRDPNMYASRNEADIVQRTSDPDLV